MFSYAWLVECLLSIRKLIHYFILFFNKHQLKTMLNSNSLLKLTWQIYSFAKSQNQMPSEKRGLLQQFAIWAWQKNLASQDFCQNHKIEPPTSWQNQLANWDTRDAKRWRTWHICQVKGEFCQAHKIAKQFCQLVGGCFFMVLVKILGCQVLLANCWSCSKQIHITYTELQRK